MLEELLIRDVGVIEEISLTLEPGLNVVTGETGAGKTMVVSALELLLGARADVNQVRAGAPSALVEGRLRPPPPAAVEWVADGDDDLVVSREVLAGRSRARIGGRLAPASALAEVVGSVVEVHGQADTNRLTQPAVQRDLLDRAGGEHLAAALERYRGLWRRWQAAAGELAALEASERERARELDRLRYELAEIDATTPEVDEDVALDQHVARLEHAEALAAAAAAAAAALSEDGGARDALGSAVAHLRPLDGVDAALDGLVARAEGLSAEVQDLSLELAAYRDGVEHDPAHLEQLRARQAALQALQRKYGPTVGDVLAYAERARTRAGELERGEDRADALAAEVVELQAEAGNAADELHGLRKRAAAAVSAAVENHLADLAMADAEMTITVEPDELGPHGGDRVTFQLAANPGEPPLPLAKASSGGERSRVALAVRLALADADRTPTVLVFDEVDAGIGGATALEVGRKLTQLAHGRQVLCVTHLAQLAAFADAHVLVMKQTDGGRTRAVARRLDDDERITELSRMLSGTPESRRATEHAAELRASALAAAQG